MGGENRTDAIPIVALTAHTGGEASRKSLDCTAHFTKPIRKATLLEAISRYLGLPKVSCLVVRQREPLSLRDKPVPAVSRLMFEHTTGPPAEWRPRAEFIPCRSRSVHRPTLRRQGWQLPSGYRIDARNLATIHSSLRVAGSVSSATPSMLPSNNYRLVTPLRHGRHDNWLLV